MRKIILLFILISLTNSSCSLIKIKIVEDKVSLINENSNNNFVGKYEFTIFFGEPYGDYKGSLELLYDNNSFQSKITYFDGNKYVPLAVNKTELYEGAIFISLEDTDIGTVEMEVYFDDDDLISGFYAGQFKFSGEKINIY
tara:strand:+ start:353 stop:775 length:423 start_codon:yes stop_codon:yes gene_type:complete